MMGGILRGATRQTAASARDGHRGVTLPSNRRHGRVAAMAELRAGVRVATVSDDIGRVDRPPVHRMHGSDANGQIHDGYVRHVHRAGHGAGLLVRYGRVKHNAHPTHHRPSGTRSRRGLDQPAAEGGPASLAARWAGLVAKPDLPSTASHFGLTGSALGRAAIVARPIWRIRSCASFIHGMSRGRYFLGAFATIV